MGGASGPHGYGSCWLQLLSAIMNLEEEAGR